MVGKVLTGNGITAYGNGAYSLIGGDDPSDAKRDELLELCCQQLEAFREQRGEEVACLLFRSLRLRALQPPPQPDQRLSELQGARPRPGPLRVCGAHEHQRALEVAPIIPRLDYSARSASG